MLCLLQKNKGVYLDLSLVCVLYLILKLKLSHQNVNSISHLKDKAQLCISCQEEVRPSEGCACVTWQEQIHNGAEAGLAAVQAQEGWRAVI